MTTYDYEDDVAKIDKQHQRNARMIAVRTVALVCL
jgi:hypothetical protein